MTQVRISVANIAPFAIIDGRVFYVGLLNNSSMRSGKLEYKALGGAAMLRNKTMFETCFGATVEGVDARMIVDEHHVDSILRLLETRDSKIIETTLDRELNEELTQIELPGQTSPLLSHATAARIASTFYKTLKQTPFSEGDKGSARAGQTPTYRLLNLFQIEIPLDLLPILANCEKLHGVPILKFISEAEMNQGVTTDGVKIGGNIFRR
ncbi:hypothetical protein BH10CYA1_BH10CYA1_18260 [soil metagenome]